MAMTMRPSFHLHQGARMFSQLPRIVVLACLVSGGIALAAAPNKPRTAHDVIRLTEEYNRKTLVEPYQQVGKRDRKWDDAAVKFLDVASVYWVNSSQGRLYAKPEPTAAQALAAGQAVLDQGC